jgi:hypothetical protein
MYGYQLSSNASPQWRMHGNLQFRAAIGTASTEPQPCFTYPLGERDFLECSKPQTRDIADTCPPGRARSLRSYPGSRRRRRR